MPKSWIVMRFALSSVVTLISGSSFSSWISCSVIRVGRVRDQLAHEDLLLGVERVDDDIEQLLDLGLEFERLRRGVGHGCEKGKRRV
jgi:uncharacterized protein (DUF1786 family)